MFLANTLSLLMLTTNKNVIAAKYLQFSFLVYVSLNSVVFSHQLHQLSYDDDSCWKCERSFVYKQDFEEALLSLYFMIYV